MIIVEYIVTHGELEPSRLGTTQYLFIRPSRNGANITRDRNAPVVESIDHKSYQSSFTARWKTLQLTQDAIDDTYMANWNECVESIQDNQLVKVYAVTEPLLNSVYMCRYTNDSESFSEFACKKSTRQMSLKVYEDDGGIDFAMTDDFSDTDIYGWSDWSGRDNIYKMTGSFINSGQDTTRIRLNYRNYGDIPLGVFLNGRQILELPKSLTTVNQPFTDIPRSDIQAGINKISVVQSNIGADWGIQRLWYEFV